MLCIATDLALRATKITAQAIGRSMASLVVLERHLWLTFTEIKDADKVTFLDSPVSPTYLFGPAVEGFAECFTAVQKSSQAMLHILPKRSSFAAASSRPKTAPTQQPVKPAPPAAQSASKPEPRHRFCSARRYPFHKRQGPWPKIVLDLAPQASSRTKGSPVTKQRLSKWIIDAVALAYSSLGLQCPLGVRAHSTSWAWSSGVSLQRFVWRPAGPRHPHLPGFIIWTSWPYRPGSFLHNGFTLVI